MYYRFIEIGTSDFGTLVEDARDFDHGICVEPIYEYINRLPVKPNVHYITGAIGVEDGTCEIQFIPPDAFDSDDNQSVPLNWFLRGSNTIREEGHHLFKKIDEDYEKIIQGDEGKGWFANYDYAERLIKRTVPQISPKTLVETYNIEGCEILKLDIEGIDAEIVRQFCDIWRENKMDLPHLLIYEDTEEDKELIEMLVNEFKFVYTNSSPFERTFQQPEWERTWG